MAARTIEPATGASTWAFGSHRCIPYRGIFTKKAIKHPAHQILSLHELRIMGWEYWRVSIESVPVLCCIRSRATKSGRDPANV